MILYFTLYRASIVVTSHSRLITSIHVYFTTNHASYTRDRGIERLLPPPPLARCHCRRHCTPVDVAADVRMREYNMLSNTHVMHCSDIPICV